MWASRAPRPREATPPSGRAPATATRTREAPGQIASRFVDSGDLKVTAVASARQPGPAYGQNEARICRIAAHYDRRRSSDRRGVSAAASCAIAGGAGVARERASQRNEAAPAVRLRCERRSRSKTPSLASRAPVLARCARFNTHNPESSHATGNSPLQPGHTTRSACWRAAPARCSSAHAVRRPQLPRMLRIEKPRHHGPHGGRNGDLEEGARTVTAAGSPRAPLRGRRAEHAVPRAALT